MSGSRTHTDDDAPAAPAAQDGDALDALAAAAQRRPPPLAPPPPVWRGWRIIIFLMRAWAVALFAIGLLLCVGAMLTFGVEQRAFHIVRTETSFTIYGWGLPLCVAVVAFVLSKLQSRTAR